VNVRGSGLRYDGDDCFGVELDPRLWDLMGFKVGRPTDAKTTTYFDYRQL
jgi:hypothetical protein